MHKDFVLNGVNIDWLQSEIGPVAWNDRENVVDYRVSALVDSRVGQVAENGEYQILRMQSRPTLGITIAKGGVGLHHQRLVVIGSNRCVVEHEQTNEQQFFHDEHSRAGYG